MMNKTNRFSFTVLISPVISMNQFVLGNCFDTRTPSASFLPIYPIPLYSIFFHRWSELLLAHRCSQMSPQSRRFDISPVRRHLEQKPLVLLEDVACWTVVWRGSRWHAEAITGRHTKLNQFPFSTYLIT